MFCRNVRVRVRVRARVRVGIRVRARPRRRRRVGVRVRVRGMTDPGVARGVRGCQAKAKVQPLTIKSTFVLLVCRQGQLISAPPCMCPLMVSCP